MNKYLIAGIATLTSVVAVSGLTYAGNSLASGKTNNTWSGSGRMMENRIEKMGSGRMMENIFTNSGVTAALQAKWLSTPTEAELQSYHTAMQAMMSGAMNLSDANKAELKKLRDSFQKTEREFLRSKWVTTPTDEQVAKMDAIHEVIRTTLGENGKMRGNEKMKGRSGMKHDMGGMKGCGGMENPDTPPEATETQSQ